MGILCDIVKGNTPQDLSTKDYIKTRNDILSALYNQYNSSKEKANAIEDSIVEFIFEGTKKGENALIYTASFGDKIQEVTELVSAFGLNINQFNFYLNSYIGSDKKGNQIISEMPLSAQEGAIFQQVAMITGNSSEIFDNIFKKFTATVNDIQNSKEKEYKGESYTNTIRLNAAAGTGKTKLVAGATIKIAEQIEGAKGGKTIVTALVTQMASDIYTEMNNLNVNLRNEKPMTLTEINDKLKNDRSYFDGVNKLIIDESTLIDGGSRNDNHLSTLEYLHSELNSLGIKLVLLGDTKQLSYSKSLGIGNTLVSDPSNIMANPLSKSVVGVLESKPLTESFRTTSVLIKNVLDSVRTEKNILSEENPLELKHSYAISDEDKLMGINMTTGTSQGKKDIKLRVNDFVKALSEKTNTGYSMMDSIEKQVENDTSKTFSLMYATDAGFSMDKFLSELEAYEDGKRFVKFVKDNTENFLFFSDKVSDPQGSEADYVIAEFNSTSVPNESMKVTYGAGQEVTIAKQIVYTLLSRTRAYAHIINNAPNLVMQNVAEKRPYDILSNDAIINSAEKARSIYAEVYEETNEDMYDLNNGQSEVNWNKSPVKKPNIVDADTKSKDVIIPNKKVEVTKDDNKEIESIKRTAEAMPDKSNAQLFEMQQGFIDKIQDDTTSNEDRELALDLLNKISDILTARDLLSKRVSPAYAVSDYSKIIEEIINDEKIKKLKGSEKAEAIAAILSANGFPYAYNHVKGETDIEVVDKEKELLSKLGVDISLIETSKEIKQQALGLKKTNRTFTYSLVIDEIDSKTHKIYVLSTETATGKTMLVLSTESNLWKNDTFDSMISKLQTVDAFKVNKRFTAKDINFDSIVEFITPGRVIGNDRNTPAVSLKDFFSEGGKAEEFKARGINISNKIFTYTGRNKKLKGKQFLLYTQSDSVNINNSDFNTWVDEAINEEGKNEEFSGFYKAGKIKHKVGMLMLNNKGYTFNEIYDYISDEQFSKNTDNDLFNLVINYNHMNNLTSFFSLILNDVFENNIPVDNRSNLAKVFNTKNVHTLFGKNSDKNVDDFKNTLNELMSDEEVLRLKDGTETNKGKIFKDFFSIVFSIKPKTQKSDSNLGKLKTKDGKLLLSEGKDKRKYPKITNGSLFTVITDSIDYEDSDGKTKTSNPIYKLNLKSILTQLKNYSDENLIDGDDSIDKIVTQALTALYGSTYYGKSGGIQTGVSLGKETSKVAVKHYAVTPMTAKNSLRNIDDELEVNFRDIAEAEAVLNTKAIDTVVDDELSLTNKPNKDENVRTGEDEIIIDEVVTEESQEPITESEQDNGVDRAVFIRDIDEIIDESKVKDADAYKNVVSLMLKLKPELSIDKKVDIIYDIYLESNKAIDEEIEDVAEFIDDDKSEIKEAIETNDPSVISDINIQSMFNKLNCN